MTSDEAKQAKRIFVLQSEIKAEINPKITEAKFAELLPKENKMTSDEAKQALKEGKRIKHRSWYNPNYIKEETHIIFNGLEIADDILDCYDGKGWEIVE